jgi:phytoene dehydrogenase-like protein
VIAREYDAVIVGSGPNGLAAAIALQQAGLSTLVVEAHETAGGGMRTAELTSMGFRHDVCSAVHPLGIGSPFFRSLPLARHGLRWIDSPTPLAHVLDDGHAVTLERSIDETARAMGRDERAYRELLAPIAARFTELAPMILGPLRWPDDPALFVEFGVRAMRSMIGLARGRFVGEAPSALLGGIAAHAMVPLDRAFTASFAMVLGAAGHAVGWPIAEGGSQAIADALVAHHRALGGHLALGSEVRELRELPHARAYVLDVAARDVVRIARAKLDARYVAALERFRYGPGVFKIDWALGGPIPWRDPRCGRAVTVHLSGSLDRIAADEAVLHRGRMSEQPFVLLGQPSIVDPSRAPAGHHTVWAYCHVPHGSDVDAAGRIEAHVERHAPGFRERIVARATRDARQMEAYDAGFVGGDISMGLPDARQLFFRPVARLDPYATSAPDVFICSASTPPGGGVHGMCGYWAARSVLRRVFGVVRGAERLAERRDRWREAEPST